MKHIINITLSVVLAFWAGITAGADDNIKLVAPDFTIQRGETKTISVVLEADAPVRDLMLDIQLPTELMFSGLRSNLQSHTFETNTLADGRIRLGFLSQKANTISAGTTLFSFEVEAMEQPSSIVISSIEKDADVILLRNIFTTANDKQATETQLQDVDIVATIEYAREKIEEITITGDVTHITDDMFDDMPNLHEIVVGKDVESVDEGAFDESHGLRHIIWETTNVPIPAKLFDGDDDNNILVYAAEGVKTERDHNVIINGWAENIVLVDKKPLCVPEEFKAHSVTYTRNFSKKTYSDIAGGWETIVLPFDVAKVTASDARLLAPFGVTVEDVANFWLATTENQSFALTTEFKANVPYIISMPNNDNYPSVFNITGDVTFYAASDEGIVVYNTAEVETTTIADAQIFPTYETVAEPGIYAINNEQVENYVPGGAFVLGERAVDPFECFIEIDADAPLTSKRRFIPVCELIGSADDIDGIISVTADKVAAENVYTVSGQRISKSQLRPSTVYISGGKKFIVR